MNKGIAKGLVAAGLGLAIFASPASAQNPGPEFGIQFVGFNMSNPDGDDNNATSFGFNGGNVSAAWYVSEMIAIEPTLTFDYTKLEGVDDANSSLGLMVAVPIYLKKGWGKAGGFFVAPHIGINKGSSGGVSVTSNHWGVSVGTKVRISDDLHWRFQAYWDNTVENLDDGIPKETNMGVSGGVSLYWPN